MARPGRTGAAAASALNCTPVGLTTQASPTASKEKHNFTLPVPCHEGDGNVGLRRNSNACLRIGASYDNIADICVRIDGFAVIEHNAVLSCRLACDGNLTGRTWEISPRSAIFSLRFIKPDRRLARMLHKLAR